MHQYFGRTDKTNATKDSPRLFWAKDVQKRRKLLQKRQLPEKVCERQKFFRKKTIAGKS
jgi:hypothetical protein